MQGIRTNLLQLTPQMDFFYHILKQRQHLDWSKRLLPPLQGQFDQERGEVEKLAFDIDGRLHSRKFDLDL